MDKAEAIKHLEYMLEYDAHDPYYTALDMAIKALEESRWIPCSERLPEEKTNPITKDFYVYPVTILICGVLDVRYYSFGNGHWHHEPGIMDEYVIAWKPRPEPYHPPVAAVDDFKEKVDGFTATEVVKIRKSLYKGFQKGFESAVNEAHRQTQADDMYAALPTIEELRRQFKTEVDRDVEFFKEE